MKTEAQKQNNRERYRALVNAGFCGKCHINKTIEGFSVCRACLSDPEQKKKHCESAKERRKNFILSGRCHRCGDTKPQDKHKACEACRMHQRSISKAAREASPTYKAEQKIRHRKLYDTAKAAGICVKCRKQPAAPTMANCLACLRHMAESRTKEREFVYAAYGNRCSCLPCGEARWQFLNLDHINGGGRKHTASGKLTNWAKKNGCPPSLRLLCANCNTGRERNSKICPHLTERDGDPNQLTLHGFE